MKKCLNCGVKSRVSRFSGLCGKCNGLREFTIAIDVQDHLIVSKDLPILVNDLKDYLCKKYPVTKFRVHIIDDTINDNDVKVWVAMSHDTILGIYTSKKKAWSVAKNHTFGVIRDFLLEN